MKQKIISNIILVLCFMYSTTSSTSNWLDNQVETPRPAQNNSKSYLLFDNSGQGSMTKIYDQSSNQVKFIRQINDSRIQIIPGYNP